MATSEDALDRSSEFEELDREGLQSETVPAKASKRVATVYDAIAGRVGFRGFLTNSQLQSNITALAPEEVLLRRVNAPSKIPHDFYSASENLKLGQRLPDSDLLKSFHSHASDFYTAISRGPSQQDFKSLDETALLAVGILLEEAAREILGENGDMVLVEPDGFDQGLPESSLVKHQVNGRMKPPPNPQHASEVEEGSDESLSEQAPRNFKRRRY